MAKLRQAWQMIWSLNVIVEWIEKQSPSQRVSQSRKCHLSPQQDLLCCTPYAHLNAKPCLRRRQFQIERLAEELQLTVKQGSCSKRTSLLPNYQAMEKCHRKTSVVLHLSPNEEPASLQIISTPALDPLSPSLSSKSIATTPITVLPP